MAKNCGRSARCSKKVEVEITGTPPSDRERREPFPYLDKLFPLPSAANFRYTAIGFLFSPPNRGCFDIRSSLVWRFHFARTPRRLVGCFHCSCLPHTGAEPEQRAGARRRRQKPQRAAGIRADVRDFEADQNEGADRRNE